MHTCNLFHLAEEITKFVKIPTTLTGNEFICILVKINGIIAINLLHITFKYQYSIIINIIYRLYKNKVKETVGWNPEVLRWCLNAAKESGMKEADYMGGLVIDKMKIHAGTCSDIKGLPYKKSIVILI